MIDQLSDLFDAVPTECHPVYAILRVAERKADVRQHINAMWKWYAEKKTGGQT